MRADLKRVKRDLDSGALGISRATPTVTSGDAQSSASTTRVPVRPPSGTTTTAEVVTVQKNRGLVIGLSIAAAALVAALVTVTMFRGSSTTGPPAQNLAATPPAAPAPVAAPPAQAQPPGGADTADSARRRADAARFDQAIVDGNRFLAAGDADAANRELSVARAIDPSAPAVADLSGASRRTLQDGRQRTPAAHGSCEADAAGITTFTRGSHGATARSDIATSDGHRLSPRRQHHQRRHQTPPRHSRPQSGSDTARPPAVELSPVPATQPPPARPEPAERRAAAPPPAPAAAPAPAPVEDDDAAIRRVVATYARAIETKDLALYRTVKPNLSPAEQRTIEDGFRAVTSQRVTITIQSIERRPPGRARSFAPAGRDPGVRTATNDRQPANDAAGSNAGWLGDSRDRPVDGFN